MKAKQKTEQKISWFALALMAFSTVWGFGNVINGFAVYGGLRSIVPWILVFVLYFIPYALMVGELGSAFRKTEGGVRAWVQETMSARLAFYAGWTYWVVHMPYISQKPTTALIAAGWALFRDGRISQGSPLFLHLGGLLLFLVCLFLAGRGISWIKRIAALAGTSIFVMSLLFILLMLAAPAVAPEGSLRPIPMDWQAYQPDLGSGFWLNLSILILAVGGCEKISPYINKMEDPKRGFPRGMIALAVMVMVCAVLGTIAMGMIVDSENIPADFMTNGAYFAFRKVGAFYGIGDTLMVIYAVAYFISQIAVIILSVDAPLRMLLEGADPEYIPAWLTHKNKNGTFQNGYLVIGVIVSVLIMLPALGIGNINEIVRYLIRLNAICMPLRYLWVFAAYIGLKRQRERASTGYQFVKNKSLGMGIGAWCFGLTAYSCISGILNVESTFQLVMNLATPFLLIGLGFVLSWLAKRGGDISTKR